MEQFILIAGLIAFLVVGICVGVDVIQEASTNQAALTTQTPAAIDINHLALSVLQPTKVKPGDDCILEVFLDEALQTWSSPVVTKSTTLTLALATDPRLIQNDVTRVVTRTWSPTQTLGTTTPITFGFHIREDVHITETVGIAVRLETEGQPQQTEELPPLPVYHNGDLWREHWWRILWFGVSATVIALVLIVVGVLVRPIGILLIIIVLIVGIWFPQLLEPIKLLLSVLKEIS